MKKFLFIFLSIFSLFLVASCGEAKTLAAPTLKIEKNIVSWDKVEEASDYYVYIDGVLKSKQQETSYTILEVNPGTYKVGVKAVNAQLQSTISTIDYVILDKTNDKMYQAQGYSSLVGGFEEYENTSSHIKVKTPLEFVKALNDAKYHYSASYNEQENKIDYQVAEGYTKAESDIRIIEITADMNLGYKVLDQDVKKYTSIVANFDKASSSVFTKSKMFEENGISQLKIENTSNLLIFSRNGAKIRHAGFKLTSDFNIVFRNLDMDEMWQWEDSNSATTNKVGDYDSYGWAYFKIAYCEQIWIDHCSFGKSFDGLIDYSNPLYLTKTDGFRAPYGATGSNGLSITWCDFHAGSDSKDGFIYKMMEDIEADYKAGNGNYLYYSALRDNGYTFDEILYGIAIPQKKGFLIGDTGDGTTEYQKNLNIKVSIGNNYFKNLEDRAPKLRGGNLYFYNNILDCDEYYQARTALKTARGGKTAAEVVKAINDKWKCALVSQALLCGNEGFLNVENCLFIGVSELLKNNDGVNATFNIKNSFYQDSKSSALVPALEKIGTPGGLTRVQVKPWRTETGDAPFEINNVNIEDLNELLTDKALGCGVKTNFSYSFIDTCYTD